MNLDLTPEIPRVLVADDDPTTCLLMQAALSKAGFHVSTVANGKAALESFAAGHFDMALLDIEMPELDGYLVCSELRRLYGAALPIVLVTGHDDREAIAAGFEAGASEFISKPIDWLKLGDRLTPLLQKSKVA